MASAAPAAPAAPAASSAAPAAGDLVLVSVERDRAVDAALRDLQQQFAQNQIPDATIAAEYHRLHQAWWSRALEIHQKGQHTASRAHVLDWPAFLREKIVPEDTLHLILAAVFRHDQQTARTRTKDGKARLERAALALGLGDAIEMHMELGRDVCMSVATVRDLATLRTSFAHETIDPEDIRDEIRARMLAATFARPGPYPVPPLPSLRNVNNAITELRARAVPKAARQPRSGNRKRKSAAITNDDDDEAQPQPQLYRSLRRRSSAALRDRQGEMEERGRAFVERLENDGTSMLSTFLHPDDDDDTILSYHPPAPALPAQEEEEENDNEGDAVAAAVRQKKRHEADADALVKEQLEMCSRLFQRGAPPAEACGDVLLANMLEGLQNMAKSVLMRAKEANTTGHLETRRLDREGAGVNSGEEEE